MDNRKSNCAYAYIERVNDRKTTYRLKISDGSNLELDKAEIGGFIPQSGMPVQIRLFNNLILQEVFLDGISVLHRTPQQLMKLLEKEFANLEKADIEHQQIAELESSQDYQQLPIAFQHRLRLLKTIMKKDFTAKLLQRQLIVCQIAVALSQKPGRSDFEFAKAIDTDLKPAKVLDSRELADAKCLSRAWQNDWKNRFKSFKDYQNSSILNYKAYSTPYALRPGEAIKRYFAATIAG